MKTYFSKKINNDGFRVKIVIFLKKKLVNFMHVHINFRCEVIFMNNVFKQHIRRRVSPIYKNSLFKENSEGEFFRRPCS